MLIRNRIFAQTIIATCIFVTLGIADETTPLKRVTVPRPNLKIKTLGGKQFWSDVLWLHDWRIQLHAISKHYRLLDNKNARRAWGTYDECATALADARKSQQLQKPKETVVVLLHGLGRSCDAMHKMASVLKQDPQWEVANLNYASGRLSIDEHAENLQRVMETLSAEGVKDVHVVAHSLGNLLTRRYLGLQSGSEKDQAKTPEIKRIVMLGPPNQGSKMAAMLKKNLLFRLLAGKSGQQIAELTELKDLFPTPDCEFAIIAGGRGKETGRNPVLSGDDDMIVSVGETKLPGARDFMVVTSLHTFIMNDDETQEATLRFLKDGYFKSEEERTPLE